MNRKLTFCAAVLAALLLTASLCFAEDAAALQVGDIVTFGRYEQDNDLDNGAEPIEWRVLLIDGGDAQLVSQYALDAQPWNKGDARAKWTKCTLRTWLNDEFYNAAFDEAEKAVIVTKEIPNYEELNTADPVYLLSCDEAKRLFSSHQDRMVLPTQYAISRGIYQSKKYGPGNAQWWLRTHSWEDDHKAAYVAGSGGVMTCGGTTDGRVDNAKWAVRPAIYVSVDALSGLQAAAATL